MRIGLLTEGARPYATGESRLGCDRLVRGRAGRAFALSRPAHHEGGGRTSLPYRVNRVRTAPPRAPGEGIPCDGIPRGGRRGPLASAAGPARAPHPLPPAPYDREGRGAADPGREVSGGTVAVPGLLTKRFFRMPPPAPERFAPFGEDAERLGAAARVLARARELSTAERGPGPPPQPAPASTPPPYPVQAPRPAPITETAR
ncbi:hypothetical protein [Streptomyces californicus]|uniref:hypothetical protein n=1 Tax=Streptomyces californicus TaxID=67351 RepID=UPI0036CEB165